VEFARIWGTVADPTTVAHDLKAGRLAPSQVEALRAVYPSIYDDLKMSTAMAVAQADQSGKSIPIQTRQQLAMLLGSDGIGDSALSGDLGDKINGMLAKAQQTSKPKPQQPSTRAQTRIIDSARSPFEASQET
jgi:hypothetical protein